LAGREPPAERPAGSPPDDSLTPEPSVMEQTRTAPRAGDGGDPYARAAAFTQALESALKQANLWPGEKPPGEIEVRGAFGSENMSFPQWLAWILIPRVLDIVATRGSFPSRSQVSTKAAREFDGCPEADPVVRVLGDFDDMINGLS
jgi:uncharacterized protein YqcC (DUF446 family)